MGAKLGVRHQLWPPSMAPVHGHGPIPFMAIAPFQSWPWRIPFMAIAPFQSWPWRIPFMAMAHSIHGHGAFLPWPWSCRCRTPITVTVAPLNPGACPGVWPAHHPREDFAWIDRFRGSKLTGVRGGSGGSLPSIRAITEH